MIKKVLSAVLAAMILLACIPAALGETGEELTGTGDYIEPRIMYVYTDNGKALNVRSEPRITKTNLIGRLEYGAPVEMMGLMVLNSEWAVIAYRKGPDGVGYVQRRYLVRYKPAPKEDDEPSEEETRRQREQQELDRQLASSRALATPLMLAVRAPRTTSWVNFRVGPGVAASRITSLPDGYTLKAIGETDSWYQVIDPQSGRIGYISKNYATVLQEVPVTPVAMAKEQMGTLNVNGEFALQCRLPNGYHMQLINQMSQKIIAFITPDDTERPILQLSIAPSEIYAGVDRLNSLTPEELAPLENSFTNMNVVSITYGQTAYGTKLLIARETGSDDDFVDIMTVYKGYSIEFVMSPNPNAQDKTLNDRQVQMCIDFLTELDFVELK